MQARARADSNARVNAARSRLRKPVDEDASSPAVTNLPLCWTAIDEAHDDRRVPDLFHRAQPAHDFRKNRIGWLPITRVGA